MLTCQIRGEFLISGLQKHFLAWKWEKNHNEVEMLTLAIKTLLMEADKKHLCDFKINRTKTPLEHTMLKIHFWFKY